jgi:hypothetical protein
MTTQIMILFEEAVLPDQFQLPSPFCVIRCLQTSTEVSTDLVGPIRDPNWDATFTVGISDSPNDELLFSVLDHSRPIGSNLIGAFRIPTSRIPPNDALTDWFVLIDPSTGTEVGRLRLCLERVILKPSRLDDSDSFESEGGNANGKFLSEGQVGRPLEGSGVGPTGLFQ